MYLRAAKTEAEDAGESTDGMANSVSELRGELLKLTGNKVDIQIDEDTFKSTYQIMKELAGVWDDLTDVTQANILEIIGGKRNANATAALLENFDIAESVIETAANSAGSALAENEKYLDSIAGKISQFKASFEALSATVVNSDFVKFVVDLGTKLINALDFIIDKFGAVGIAIGVTQAAIKLAPWKGLLNTITKIVGGGRMTPLEIRPLYRGGNTERADIVCKAVYSKWLGANCSGKWCA